MERSNSHVCMVTDAGVFKWQSKHEEEKKKEKGKKEGRERKGEENKMREKRNEKKGMRKNASPGIESRTFCVVKSRL